MSKSSTITTDADLLPNPTPGDVLLEDFLKPMGLSQNELARALRVPPRRINEIVLGKRSISADTDLRLAWLVGEGSQVTHETVTSHTVALRTSL